MPENKELILSKVWWLLVFLGIFSVNSNIINIWPISGFFFSVVLSSAIFIFFVTSLLLAAKEGSFSISAASMVLLPILLSLLITFLMIEEVKNSSLSWSNTFLIFLGVGSAVVGQGLKVGGREIFVHKVGWIIVWSLCIYSLLALLHYYGVMGGVLGGLKPGPGRLQGSWHQPNLTSSTLWIGIASLAFVTQKYRSVWFFTCLLLFSIVIGLTASRINYLFVVLALVLGGFAVCNQRDKITFFGKKLLISGGFVSLCLAFVPGLSATFEPLLVQYGWMPSESATSLADRGMVSSARIQEHLKILSALMDWSWQQWLFGVGPGGYGNFSFEQAVQSPEVGQGQAAWLHSHNLFSMILVEQGLIGTIAVLLVLLLIARQLWVHRENTYAWLVAAVVGIIFLHSMVEYPLWYPWYLWVTLLFLVPVFPVYRVRITSPWVMRLLAVMVLAVGGAVIMNQTYLGFKVISIAGKQQPTEKDYRELSAIGADGLMGGYATLARYRKFAPDRSGIERQLKEVQWMEQWRPVDLVKSRKVTLFLLDGRFDAACRSARRTAKRYPHTGPIMAKKILKIGDVDMVQVNEFLGCIEEGLAPWGETIESMEKRNKGEASFSDQI